jgi:hypothetical protein
LAISGLPATFAKEESFYTRADRRQEKKIPLVATTRTLECARCHAQLLAVTIRVIWLVGFSVEDVLPSLVQ